MRGCSPGPCACGISTWPGVCPCASKRLARRASASLAFTGKRLVRPAAGMDDVVRAPAERSGAPAIHHVEHERRVNTDRRMQRGGWLPGPEAHTGHERPRSLRRLQGDEPAVAGDRVPRRREAVDPDLQPLDRRVDVAGGRAARLLPEHVPGLDRLAQLDRDPVDVRHAEAREAELEERLEPGGVEREAVLAQVARRRRRCPRRSTRAAGSGRAARCPSARAARGTGRASSARRARARAAPARAPSAGAAASRTRAARRRRGARARVGAEELVDAELGPVRVAGEVDEEVAQQRGRPARAGAACPRPPAGRARRTRSRARRGCRRAPRRRAAPGSWGPRTARRTGRRAPGGAARR